MSKKLYFFTNSYPYGLGELWKTNELNVLVDFFDKITVIPFSYGGNTKPVLLIKGVDYQVPLFNNGISYSKWYKSCFQILFSKHLSLFLSEAKKEKVFYSAKRFIKWFSASYKMLQIANNKSFKKIISGADENTILYFYWGRETSEALPLLKVNCFKIITRFHRYDLYKYANDGYIPYQYYQIKRLDIACACSSDGQNTLADYYPGFTDKIVTKRLGTVTKGKASSSEDGILRIVSCSLVEPVKRVDIIARALERLDIDTEWLHIGEGSLLKDIKSLANNSKNKKIKFSFLGQVSNEQVINYYSNNTIDLFINVSGSEGIPISIMEALAAGIPVMAADVGGTKEIVNNQVGMLLSKEVSSAELAEKINIFYKMDKLQKSNLRTNAFTQYLDKCEATNLAKDFASFLISE